MFIAKHLPKGDKFSEKDQSFALDLNADLEDSKMPKVEKIDEIELNDIDLNEGYETELEEIYTAY